MLYYTPYSLGGHLEQVHSLNFRALDTQWSTLGTERSHTVFFSSRVDMDLSAATTETPFYGERRHFLTALRLNSSKKEQPITDRYPVVERHAFGQTRTENSSLSSVQHII